MSMSVGACVNECECFSARVCLLLRVSEGDTGHPKGAAVTPRAEDKVPLRGCVWGNRGAPGCVSL